MFLFTSSATPKRLVPLQRGRKRRAFTLIEILVVIVIMGILAAIRFPDFARARAGARRASCSSNLRQIGLGAMQYTQDNAGTLMRNWSGTDFGPSDATERYKWMDAIQPYIRNTKVFTCPSDSLNPPYIFRDGKNYGSYCINGAYFSEPVNVRRSPNIARQSRIADPSGTLWVGDSYAESGETFSTGWPDVAANPTIDETVNPRKFDRLIERHLGTLNVLYCDGHVKAVSLDLLAHKNAADTLTAFTIQND